MSADPLVGERTASALREIDDALQQNGFARSWSHTTHPRYQGSVDGGGRSIAISIEIVDLDFVRFPVVRLEERPQTSRTLVPHLLGPDRQICYLSSSATVLDRYSPGPTVLRCLRRAELVLRDALQGRSVAELEAEFFSYWGRSTILVNLPVGFRGEAAIHISPLRRDETQGHVVLAEASNRGGGIGHHSDQAKRLHAKSASHPCTVFRIERALGASSARPLPSNLGQLVEWLEDNGIVSRSTLDKLFATGSGNEVWLGVQATNGCFVAEIEIPQAYRKKEFMENRRNSLFQTLQKVADQVAVRRHSGRPIDRGYVYKRNLGQAANLADKRILLIGCGTIGGFLAQQLAQSGAGSGDLGELHLLDSDVLLSGNLGRHLLGLPYLSMNKAEACRSHLLEHLPHLRIEATAGSVLDHLNLVRRYDLVIDATGEEGVSIALNDFLVRMGAESPPALFVWLVGNGAAAQAILSGERRFACYKCLKPVLHGPPRFPVLKDDAVIRHEQNHACGDGDYLPFPVSRSVVAAALGLELALAWSTGKPRARFRTRVLDEDRAYRVKDSSPEPSAGCPACGSPVT